MIGFAPDPLVYGSGRGSGNGLPGAAGASAYQLAVANGFVGSVQDWLASLEGDPGKDGDPGQPGNPGDPGGPGAPGASAYALAVQAGFVGTVSAWLESLVGEPGQPGAGLKIVGTTTDPANLPPSAAPGDGYLVGGHLWVWDGAAWNDVGVIQGPQGPVGLNAYQLAAQNGFVGNLAAWLISLKGAKGDDGRSAFQVAVDDGFTGDATAWLASLVGPRGKSVYQVAVDGGFSGSEAEFLDTLKGAPGNPGERGERGATGSAVVGTPSVGARVYHAGVQQYPLLNTWDTFKWDAVDRDTASFWAASAPSRLTVPAGVSKVRLSAGVSISTTNKIGANRFQLRKNGIVVAGLGMMTLDYGSTYSDIGDILNSGVVSVVTGDFFELFYYSAESFDVVGGGQTWFEIEVVEVGGGNAALGFAFADLVDVDTSVAPVAGSVPIYDAVTKKLRFGTPAVAEPVQPAGRRMFAGALVGLSSAKTFSSGPQNWDVVEYDTHGFWSASYPRAFTIPAGKRIRLVRLTAHVRPDPAFVWDGDMNGIFYKNQQSVRGLPQVSVGKNVAFQTGGFLMTSAPIKVVDDDNLTFTFNAANTGNTRMSTGCFFAIEVLAFEGEI